MTPRTPPFRSILTGLAATLILGLVTGCASYREDWSGVPERKEPQVNLVRYAHSVRFASGSAHLEESELEGLDAFLARIQANSTDTVIVAGPGGDALPARRRDVVMAYLAHRAVHPRAATGPAVEAAGPDAVSVSVQRYSVTLPACPDWTERPGRSWSNTVDLNWGCATATNLGLMVFDPGDLAAGRVPGPMDGAASVLAIQRYRTGETTPLIPEDVGVIEKQQKEKSGSGGSNSTSGGSQ